MRQLLDGLDQMWVGQYNEHNQMLHRFVNVIHNAGAAQIFPFADSVSFTQIPKEERKTVSKNF